MARKRNYKEEYKRRLARGKARGMSPAQSRGHPRKGEPLLSSPKALPKSDAQIEAAIKLMRDGASMARAAKNEQISARRLGQFIRAHKIARFKGRNWVWSDRRIRQVPFLVSGQQVAIKVPDFETASQVGNFYNDVHRFLNSNDPRHLGKYIGKHVKDIRGRTLEFETNASTLYRFADRDEPAFHEIYRVVAA